MIKQAEIFVQTREKGLYLITDNVIEAFKGDFPKQGLLNVFIQHTSASLIIQENADPSAKKDLETFLDKLVPDGEAWHEHVQEGPDDTTSHMRSIITSTSINIPIQDSKLALGTWQGLYLWEHRVNPHRRQILLTLL